MASDIVLFAFAVVPIAWLFVSFCVLRHPGHIACAFGLAFAGAIAFFVNGMAPAALGAAALEGLVLALWPILIVIVSATILYKYSAETGGMEKIKQMLTGISPDRRVLVLILAWGFGGFLEAVAGFGTPVLIPGAILVSLGFSPMLAVVACLVANSTPTPFATIGIPVLTLSDATGLDASVLGFDITLQLFIPTIIMPFFLVMLVGGGVRAIRGVFCITLISGLSFALPMLFVAHFIGPEMPALLGSLCALACTAVACKRFCKDSEHNKKHPPSPSPSTVSAFRACLPFGVLFVLVIVANLAGLSVNPGILILLAIVVSCLVQGQGLAGFLRIARDTVLESRNLFITIIAIVAMAKIMDRSGMTEAIALMLIAVFARYYPLVAPVIGMLGTFITGSNTAGSVLFGPLQVGAAQAIGTNPAWIASGGLSAAAMGKMISPQSVAIGLQIGGLDGREGDIIRATLKYALFCTAIVCVITYAATALWF